MSFSLGFTMGAALQRGGSFSHATVEILYCKNGRQACLCFYRSHVWAWSRIHFSSCNSTVFFFLFILFALTGGMIIISWSHRRFTSFRNRFFVHDEDNRNETCQRKIIATSRCLILLSQIWLWRTIAVNRVNYTKETSKTITCPPCTKRKSAFLGITLCITRETMSIRPWLRVQEETNWIHLQLLTWKNIDLCFLECFLI